MAIFTNSHTGSRSTLARAALGGFFKYLHYLFTNFAPHSSKLLFRTMVFKAELPVLGNGLDRHNGVFL